MSGFAMSGAERSKPIADGESPASKQPPCRALVAVAEPTQWRHHPIRVPSPDSTFVTQLLATDEQLAPHAPDALSAYRPRHLTRVGLLTRQII